MDKKFTVKVSTKPQRNTMHFEAQRSGANRAQVFTPKKGKGSYSRKIKHAMGLEQQATAEACFSFILYIPCKINPHRTQAGSLQAL